MIDVLVARGGFADDTALLRLHHGVGLSVRALDAGLAGVTTRDIHAGGRTLPACLVFAVDPSSRGGVADAVVVTRALAVLSDEVVDVAFVAVVLGDPERAGTHLCAELLDAGADQVIPVGLDPREFAARLGATVRRMRRARGSLEQSAYRPRVDGARRELVGPRSRIPLTAKEATLMSVLTTASGVVGREELGSTLWTGTWTGSAKAIDMHIANLRRKLPHACGAQWQIETVRGAGFVLVPSSDGATSPREHAASH